MADLCTVDGRQQANSVIVNFFSADSPTGMFRQLPTDLSALTSHCSLAAPYTCRVSCGAHTTYHVGCGAGAFSQPINWWSSKLANN